MTPTSAVVNSAYLRDVLDQSRALTLTLERLEVTPGLRRIAARLNEGGFRRVVLTGMGSSVFSQYPLHIELTEKGYTSIAVETSELIHYLAGLLDPTTLIVAVSQSGQSAEIVRLLEHNAGRATVVGVTNTPESPLSSRADAVLLTHAGEESSVSCKTYVTALVALRVLATVLCQGNEEQTRQELMQVVPAAETYLGSWDEHVTELAGKADGIRHWILLGRGPSLAAARTGALNIEEAVRFSAEGMSSAAFRHGPMEILSPETFVIVYSGDGKGRELNLSLHEQIRNLGFRAELIGEDAKGAFRLPEAPAPVRTTLEIMPIQMLILALASRTGIEPGRFLIASKTTTLE
jgi:glutamine---fructose-6-phosphate transaminase (isomerizing)